mmetsp:Transcript_10943/g.32427  ORF Transcript_10943/g.32427 Transcript_10943/m.32427 type:complete len:288 (-) Transcript_10943:690-1553(-)
MRANGAMVYAAALHLAGVHAARAKAGGAADAVAFGARTLALARAPALAYAVAGAAAPAAARRHGRHVPARDSHRVPAVRVRIVGDNGQEEGGRGRRRPGLRRGHVVDDAREEAACVVVHGHSIGGVAGAHAALVQHRHRVQLTRAPAERESHLNACHPGPEDVHVRGPGADVTVHGGPAVQDTFAKWRAGERLRGAHLLRIVAQWGRGRRGRVYRRARGLVAALQAEGVGARVGGKAANLDKITRGARVPVVRKGPVHPRRELARVVIGRDPEWVVVLGDVAALVHL